MINMVLCYTPRQHDVRRKAPEASGLAGAERELDATNEAQAGHARSGRLRLIT
jgi:hypothetical protein